MQQTQFCGADQTKGEESVDPVRSKESRGTCKTSKGRRDGSTGSMDYVEHRKLTWGDIWKYEPLRFSFLLRSVYDLLPSPANPCRWGLTTDPKCSLCDKPGTLENVLSSCSTALTQGRYRWRHDSVLRELADWLEKERKKEHGYNPQHGQNAFVKSGDTRKTQTAQPTLQDRCVGSSTAKPTLQNRSVGSSILGLEYGS